MSTDTQIALLDMQKCVEWMRLNNCEAKHDVKFRDGWRCDYAAGMRELELAYEEAKARALAGPARE
jgi:hypothetical protein